MLMIETIEELDRKLAECNQAEKISDDALRATFETFCMKYSLNNLHSPDSSEYLNLQMKLYETIAGRPYSSNNETTKLSDIRATAYCPCPFSTASGVTTGEHFMAIGFLLRAMALPPQSKILEFGPGWGNTTLMLAKLGHQVTAVDIEPDFCSLIKLRAEQEGLNIDVINADFFWAEKIQEKFNAIIFFECFHHCADHQRLLRSLPGLLRTGGKVFFGSEPIVPDFPLPWGLRLDGSSLWAIRKNGWMELGFRDTYFKEALARVGFYGKKHNCLDPAWATVWEAGQLEDFSICIPASDPRLFTQVGRIEGDTLVVDTAKRGYGLFGPYLSLPAGQYKVEIKLADTYKSGNTRLEFVSLNDHFISAKNFALNPDIDTIVDEFNLTMPVDGFEVRLFCEEGVKLNILSVSIKSPNCL